MIKITPEFVTLTRLKINYDDSSNFIEVYIKQDNTEYLVQQMQDYIDNKLEKCDVIGLYEVVRKFIFENNIEYYEIYKIG